MRYRSLVVFQDSGRRTAGIPPILVKRDKLCDDCGKIHDFEKCPTCDGWIEIGYGLMGGGMGQYKFCRTDRCDWFYKEFDGLE